MWAAGGAEPEEWQDAIDDAWWYRVSSFCYCYPGLLLLLRPEPLYRAALPRCGWFPFRLMGASVALNGPLSYMGDVVTWGRPSRWKTADRVLATTNTLVTSSLIPFGALGLMHFPLASVVVLAVGIVAALLCKRRATLAISAATNCREYLIFHSLWHLILPAAATIAQLLLEWNFAQDSSEPVSGIGVRFIPYVS